MVKNVLFITQSQRESLYLHLNCSAEQRRMRQVVGRFYIRKEHIIVGH